MAKLSKAQRKFRKLWDKYLSDPSISTAIKMAYWADKADWKGLAVLDDDATAAGGILDKLRDELDSEGAPTERPSHPQIDTYLEQLELGLNTEINDGFGNYEEFLWAVHEHAEKHNTSGGVKSDNLDWNHVDRHGFLPSANNSLIGTEWMHSGNSNVYRIVNFAWMGATDEWGFVHRRVDEQMLLVRPMSHLSGERANGKKRYTQVPSAEAPKDTLPDCLKDGHIIDPFGNCRNCGIKLV